MLRVVSEGGVSRPVIPTDNPLPTCPCCQQHWRDARAIELHRESCSVSINGHVIRFSPQQYDVFEAIAKRSPSFTSNDRLIHAVYGGFGEEEPDSAAKTIQVFVCKIRQRLLGTGWSIESRVTVGYRLQNQEREPRTPAARS
jgi:DNA-binding response OmpR family regulator